MHTNIKFSVIIPSYLGTYNGCATNRPAKLRRAIESVLYQTYENFELLVIADGCEETIKIVDEYCDDHRINWLFMKKQEPFSGKVRQKGLEMAEGEYIIYLDSDDMYEPDHLEKVNGRLDDYDWVFFNDSQFNGTKYPQQNTLTFGSAKTSNICHKNGLEVKWTDGYAHDFDFVKQLMNYKYKHIGDSGYLVCHVPDLIDY